MKRLTTQSVRLNGENALLKEANADALLKVTITMQIGKDEKGRSVLIPFLSVEMDGASNGGFRSATGNTCYFSIDVKGPSYLIKDGKAFTREEFFKIIQPDVLVEGYRKILTQVRDKEKSVNDYEHVWTLQ